VEHYPTISRRVDDLKNRGYLDTVGKRLIIVGKRTQESPTYALTWRGFIAGLAIETVAREIPKVLKNNPLLEIPFPKEMAISVLSELLTPKETEVLAHALLFGFLNAIPRDIESVDQDKYIAYVIPALVETSEIRERFQKKDLSRLFQIPGFSEFVMD
jgi:hypothetical protein